VPNFKPLCGKTWEQVLANVLGKARTKTASNNNKNNKMASLIQAVPFYYYIFQ